MASSYDQRQLDRYTAINEALCSVADDTEPVALERELIKRGYLIIKL